MIKSPPLLSIVIPIYNEADNIEKTLRTIRQNIRTQHEVLVIYDYDEDTTLPVLCSLQKRYKNLSIFKNSVARGPSGAIRTGFTHARALRVLVMMADLCDDTTQVEELLALVPKKADIACPSRYSKGGQQQLKSSLKVWAPKAAGLLLSGLTGLPTSDPTNSFKLYSKSLLNKLSLTSEKSFSVTLEIIAKAHCLGYRITEVPTTWRDRQHGKTNFKLGQSLIAYFPWFCVALLRNRLFHFPRGLMSRILDMY